MRAELDLLRYVRYIYGINKHHKSNHYTWQLLDLQPSQCTHTHTQVQMLLRGTIQQESLLLWFPWYSSSATGFQWKQKQLLRVTIWYVHSSYIRDAILLQLKSNKHRRNLPLFPVERASLNTRERKQHWTNFHFKNILLTRFLIIETQHMAKSKAEVFTTSK